MMKEPVSKFDFSRWAEKQAGTVSVPRGLWQSKAARCCLSCQLVHPSPGAHGPPAHVALPRIGARARLCSAHPPGEGQRCGRARITQTGARSYSCCSCKGPRAHTDKQAWLLVLLKAELAFRLQHGGTGMRISCSIVSLLTDTNNDLPRKSWGVF